MAIYFPALFQRKLGEGLAIPWAILTVDALRQIVQSRVAQEKKLVIALAGILCCATSLRWFVEELQLAKWNVSTTTVHPVYLTKNENQVVEAVNKIRGGKVIAAMPGVPGAAFEAESQKQIPDQFGTPIVSDLNPILSGLTGAYSYAGHWSETPDYNKRRGQIQSIFLAKTLPDRRSDLIRDCQLTHLIARKVAGENPLGLFDFGGFPGAKVVFENDDFLVLQVS